MHDFSFLIHIFLFRNKKAKYSGFGVSALDKNMFHLCFVYVQSVTLYEELDFYDCGFPSASVKLKYSAAALARVASFHGRLL